MSPRDFLLKVLPYAVIAGRYAARIQQSVVRHPAKKGDSEIRQALSDADVSIQTFFEVLLLGAFPELSFFGEEYEHSLNQKYFPERAESTVLLDPVDGTLMYLHGTEEFSVVVTLINQQGYLATLWVYPRKDVFWFATRDSGVLLGKLEDTETPERWERQVLSAGGDEVLVYCSEKSAQALRNRFRIFDYRYNLKPNDKFCEAMGVFNGRWAGVYAEDVFAIDMGAMAFMAELIGAVVTDRDGAPLPPPGSLEDYCYPSILIAATPEIHFEMVEQLEEIGRG